MKKPLEEQELPSVYMVVNFKNGKYYIGQSSNAFRRWKEHFFSLLFSKYKGKGVGKEQMQEDYKNDGYSRFGFFCLSYRTNKSLRNDLEARLIKLMNPPYNTMLANKEKEPLKFDSAFLLVDEFHYSYIPQCLKDMQGMTFFEWTKLWARLVELRATGLSNRKKSDFEKMLKEVYPEHFAFKGNKIARIKNFEKKK